MTPINFNVTKRNQRMRFKKAQVIPVHKKGHKTHVNNYGPISLLSMMSKILEKIVYKKLFSFFCIVHIYPPFTRKRIVSLYFGRGVRTRLGVAISDMSGPSVCHIKAGASR